MIRGTRSLAYAVFCNDAIAWTRIADYADHKLSSAPKLPSEHRFGRPYVIEWKGRLPNSKL